MELRRKVPEEVVVPIEVNTDGLRVARGMRGIAVLPPVVLRGIELVPRAPVGIYARQHDDVEALEDPPDREAAELLLTVREARAQAVGLKEIRREVDADLRPAPLAAVRARGEQDRVGHRRLPADAKCVAG